MGDRYFSDRHTDASSCPAKNTDVDTVSADYLIRNRQQKIF